MPDVSIIIAAYNVSSYIERAIHSALNQTNINVEVIVIDDASTDETSSVVKKISDARIRLLTREKNGGPGASRNDGLNLATAPWVAVLDGDDAFAPDRMAICLKRAQSAHSDIIIDNLTVFNEATGAQSTMFSSNELPKKNLLKLADFIKGNTSFLGGKSLGYAKPIFSRTFLNDHKLRYRTDIKIGEDYIILAEALASGARCTIVRSAGYIYTVRKGSISHRITTSDISRIRNEDKVFLSKYKLDPASQKAQNKRERNLRIAENFTNLVAALKENQLALATKLTLTHPELIWKLRRPLISFINKKLSSRTP